MRNVILTGDTFCNVSKYISLSAVARRWCVMPRDVIQLLISNSIPFFVPYPKQYCVMVSSRFWSWIEWYETLKYAYGQDNVPQLPKNVHCIDNEYFKKTTQLTEIIYDDTRKETTSKLISRAKELGVTIRMYDAWRSGFVVSDNLYARVNVKVTPPEVANLSMLSGNPLLGRLDNRYLQIWYINDERFEKDNKPDIDKAFKDHKKTFFLSWPEWVDVPKDLYMSTLHVSLIEEDSLKKIEEKA